MPSRRWFQLAVVYGIALAFIAFWPTHIDKDLLLPRGVAYAIIQFTANIVLFVPFGVLASHFVGNRIVPATAAGVGVSCIIELGQWGFLPGRTASLMDVLANGSGAFVGAVLMWRAAHPPRRALPEHEDGPEPQGFRADVPGG